MIGSDRDWEGDNGGQWWGYIYIYICIWLMAVATEEKCP
jgi:hypothetical protein